MQQRQRPLLDKPLASTGPKLENLKQKQAMSSAKSAGRPPSGRVSNRPQSSTRQVTMAVVSRQSNQALMQIHGNQIVTSEKQSLLTASATKNSLKPNKYLQRAEAQPLQNLKSLQKATVM